MIRQINSDPGSAQLTTVYNAIFKTERWGREPQLPLSQNSEVTEQNFFTE